MAGLMAPQTAREAWLRGVEDGLAYEQDPGWYRLNGERDPSVPGYARIFEHLAADWLAGFKAGRAQHAKGQRAKGAPRAARIPQRRGLTTPPSALLVNIRDGCEVCSKPVPSWSRYFCSPACEKRYIQDWSARGSVSRETSRS